MRFFAKIDGIVYECHSFGEYIGTLFASCLGKLTAWLIILGLIALGIGYLLS